MATKTDILKRNLLEALEKSLGVVTTACKIVDCNRSTFYKYYNNDQDFKSSVDELQNLTLDFAESQLHQQSREHTIYRNHLGIIIRNCHNLSMFNSFSDIPFFMKISYNLESI